MGEYEKDFGAGFDPAVCHGEAGPWDEECPLLEREAEGLARVAQVFGQTVGEETCGVCGCTLAMLDATQSPPSAPHCPRNESHTSEQ